MRTPPVEPLALRKPPSTSHPTTSQARGDPRRAYTKLLHVILFIYDHNTAPPHFAWISPETTLVLSLTSIDSRPLISGAPPNATSSPVVKSEPAYMGT